ncbi:Pectate lyase family protein [Perilla frutescens var. hirtella]|nr:Pectate lyase family protein [Perilla frutescens var. frutescens]KAH6801185.1 Pectate lyase family protein [Perilla frutescens var. hirtella]
MFVFLISVAIILITTEANDADDVVWRKRALLAKQAAREAYQPNPHIVLNHLNKHVHMSMEGKNHTITNRRSLLQAADGGGPRGGACEATNPIDQCWRCDKNWDKNRKKLADCALGFGRNTVGGKAGEIYVVTDPSDNEVVNPKNGTLRHAVIQPQPLWIIFATNMVIKLSQELIMTSNKTIDGRGVHIHITGGAGLTLQFISNVIIHNIKISDIKVCSGGMIRDSVTHFGQRGKSDGDAVNMFGATHIWLDHLSLSKCYDGLIDAVQSSTAITISNCHFAQHNDVLLFGASNSYSADKIMQITVAFNHFGKGLIQRMPRVRWGFAHIVNNDYTKWEMYAMGGSQGPTIWSQGNRFVAPDNKNAKEVTKREYTDESIWKSWVWKSELDVLSNGAFFVQSGDPKHKFDIGPNMIPPKSGEFAKKLSQYSGPLKCIKGLPC